MKESYESIFNKERIRAYVIGIVNEELENLVRGYKRTVNEANDAPGAMQSRHDTSGKEASWLAQGIGRRVEELRSRLTALEGLVLDNVTDNVVLGSVVNLVDMDTYEDVNYVILPAGGGEIMEYAGNEFTIISPDSPISASLLHKKVGEQVKIKLLIGQKKYLVSNIT